MFKSNCEHSKKQHLNLHLLISHHLKPLNLHTDVMRPCLQSKYVSYFRKTFLLEGSSKPDWIILIHQGIRASKSTCTPGAKVHFHTKRGLNVCQLVLKVDHQRHHVSKDGPIKTWQARFGYVFIEIALAQKSDDKSRQSTQSPWEVLPWNEGYYVSIMIIKVMEISVVWLVIITTTNQQWLQH